MRALLTMLFAAVLAISPMPAAALQQGESGERSPDQLQMPDEPVPQHEIAQKKGGVSLSQAINAIRRKTNGRIVSAETKVSGGREVHHIKVLTKDGKVKTHKVQGGSSRNG